MSTDSIANLFQETLSKKEKRYLPMIKVMLSRLLDEKGISQNQLAKDTGISVSTLRNLAHNRTTRVSFEILEKVCQYLGCGIHDVLSLE
jgi:putative transcriptional regulator